MKINSLVIEMLTRRYAMNLNEVMLLKQLLLEFQGTEAGNWLQLEVKVSEAGGYAKYLFTQYIEFMKDFNNSVFENLVKEHDLNTKGSVLLLKFIYDSTHVMEDLFALHLAEDPEMAEIFHAYRSQVPVVAS